MNCLRMILYKKEGNKLKNIGVIYGEMGTWEGGALPLHILLT